MRHHATNLTTANAVVLVVDIQEKLLAAIHDGPSVAREAARVVRAARILDVPVLVTQQYTKGMGPTAGEVAEALGAFEAVEKLDFSAARASGLLDSLRATGRSHAVLVGIEAHVCMLQTALDLEAEGFFVHVVADATGSRKPADAAAALARMSASGVTVTTAEGAIFEMLGTAAHPRFKEIHRLVK